MTSSAERSQSVACDPSAVATHYDAIYAPVANDYPDNAVIVLFQHPGRGAKFPQVRQVPLRNRAAFVTAVVELGDAERIDLPVAPRNPDAIAARCQADEAATGRRSNPAWKRGADGEVYALPCLFLDLDVLSPRHSEQNLPSRTEALHLIDDLPLRPTLVTEGPGGFHVWLRLAAPLDMVGDAIEPSEQDVALDRLSWWLTDYAADRGFVVDTSPMTATGGLRVAGTVSGKGGPDHFDLQAIVHWNSDAAYSMTDIVEAFDEPPADFARGRTGTSRSRAARAVSSDRDGVIIPTVDDFDEPVKPGTRLAAAWPVSRMLAEVFGAELRGSRVAWPRPNGEVNPKDTHGTFVAHPDNEDIEAVIVGGHGQVPRSGVVLRAPR